jgi:hypothetical protein
MGGRTAVAVILMSALGAGGCTSATAPQLPAGPGSMQTAALIEPSLPAAGAEPAGTTIMAKGTPTEIYELVARGALGCWLGPDGPLTTSHIFHAEAKPPAEGGAAQIVLHERDSTYSDQRGSRAFRVTFARAGAGAKVEITNVKLIPTLGAAMATDVETWAAGGKGCEARLLYPPPPTPVLVGSGVMRAGKP